MKNNLIVLALIYLPLQFFAEVYRPNYKIYHSYQQVIRKLNSLSEDPDLRDIIQVNRAPYPYASVQKEPLYLVRLTNLHINSTRNSEHKRVKKIKILISFGEHAREFVSVESCLDLINYFISGWKSGCNNMQGLLTRFILDNIDLHILPILNPDGRKVLEKTGDYCHRNNGRGADLNRNADWQFGGPGSSFVPNHEEYNGGSVWSEPESRFFRDLTQNNSYDAYFSIHSGEQQLFVPFVDGESKRIKRRRPSTDLELSLVRYAVEGSSGWFHDSGIAYEMNSYSADGTLFDWIAGKLNITYSICAEIWGGPYHEDCFVQFNPKSEKLLDDLRKIRSMYTRSFEYLIQHHLGLRFPTELNYASDSRQGYWNRGKRFLIKLCQMEKRVMKLRKQ